jgi:hypothetical protein
MVDTKPLECQPTGRLTYEQLREWIDKMDEDQIHSDVVVFDGREGEYHAVEFLTCEPEEDILEASSPVLSFPVI